ncbi:hypothetical protein T281_12770 [Rhodomicrobium udaipurense JA643]|nr:hypothetical protein T281_12770 [Rhodomicrobium udaipurense JA643]
MLVAGSSALAADLYGRGGGLKDGPFYEAPALWQGFYLGGHVGAAWSKADVDDVFDYNGDPQFKGNLNTNGFTGGGQLGYNFQRGNLVFGVEGDIGYLKVDASKDVAFRPDSCTAHYPDGSVKYDGDRRDLCAIDAKYSASGGLYGDIAGRLGYSFGQTLIYAKGGVAFLDADFDAKYLGQNCKSLGTCGTGGPSTFNYSHSETLVGWTVGAGVEYKLTASWSVKAEYQYFDFGSISYSYNDCVSVGGTCAPAGSTYANHYTSTLKGSTKVDITADAVTVGLNYHIGGGEYVGLK